MSLNLNVSLLGDTEYLTDEQKNAFFSHCFEVLYEPIYAMAYNFFKNEQDAEDHAADFFKKLIQWPVSRFKAPENLAGYIRKAAYYHFINAFKAQKLRNGKYALVDETFDPQDKTDNLEKKLILKERLADVQRVIATLPQLQQKALLLKAAGYDHNEIAAQLGINRSASTSRVSRARTYIRKKLKRMATNDDEISSIT